jgi:hypothetical protein
LYSPLILSKRHFFRYLVAEDLYITESGHCAYHGKYKEDDNKGKDGEDEDVIESRRTDSEEKPKFESTRERPCLSLEQYVFLKGLTE